MNENLENIQEEEIINDEEVTTPDEVGEVSEVEDEKDSKSVPLDTFLQQKKRAKEAEKRIRELEEKFLSKERNEKLSKIRNKFKEKGYDDDFIDLQTEIYDDLYSTLAQPKSNENDLLVEEIRDLAEYGGYKDALQHKDKIIEKVKNNGLTVEEAYLLASRTAPKVYQNEIRTQAEQLNAAKRRSLSADKVLNSSGTKAESISLNNEEREMLEFLKRTQPNNNWTAERLKRNINLLKS